MPSIPKSPLAGSKIVVLRPGPVAQEQTVAPTSTEAPHLASQGVMTVKDKFSPEKLVTMENSRLLMNSYSTANSLYNNEAVMQDVGAALGNVGQSIPRTLAVSTLSASRKNVQDLINGKKSLSEVGGAVIADVSAAVFTSSVTLVANQTMVTALSRMGAASPVAAAGGMVIGFTANRLTNHLLEEKRVKETISNTGNAFFQQGVIQVAHLQQAKPAVTQP